MKAAIKILLSSIILLSLHSCYYGRPLVDKKADNNLTYNVQYLFEHDGCKVYRFYDRGNYVYFTNCADNTIAISNDSIQRRIQTTSSRITKKTTMN